MNIFDEARSIEAMTKIPGMTQKRLSELLGITQSYIANKLRLLSFSSEAQKKIIEYGLSARHARSILRLKSEERRLIAIERAHRMKMNVSRCEIMVDSLLYEEGCENMKKAATDSEKIGSFEMKLEGAIQLLREEGFFAILERNEMGERIYYNISIRK